MFTTSITGMITRELPMNPTRTGTSTSRYGINTRIIPICTTGIRIEIFSWRPAASLPLNLG